MVPKFISAAGGVHSVKCGFCEWEMVYVTPEESEYAVLRLQIHAKTQHCQNFDKVNAQVEDY